MIDLEFAKSIGAEWYRPRNECYYKVQNNTLLARLACGEDNWVRSAYDVEWAKVNLEEIDYTSLNKEKEMKGHPHAELAIQYWTEAKDDAEAWRNWEFKNPNYKWEECDDTPRFFGHVEYRSKPKTKLINGFEVPDISFVPEGNEVYYHPIITPYLAMNTAFTHKHDVFRSKTGQCYPYTPEGKAAAIKHALAMLGFDSVEEMEATLGGNK